LILSYEVVRASNPIERAFYNLETRVGVLGRGAKGRNETIDPKVSLKRIKEVRTALAQLEAACRQEVKDRAAAKKAHAEAEAARIAYENSIRAARAAAQKAAAEEPAKINPNFEREPAVEGLVAMAKLSALPDEELTVSATKTRPAGIARFLGVVGKSRKSRQAAA
jgi:hypothetical protein